MSDFFVRENALKPPQRKTSWEDNLETGRVASFRLPKPENPLNLGIRRETTLLPPFFSLSLSLSRPVKDSIYFIYIYIFIYRWKGVTPRNLINQAKDRASGVERPEEGDKNFSQCSFSELQIGALIKCSTEVSSLSLFRSSSFLPRFYVPFHFPFPFDLINIRLSSDNLVLYYNLKIYKNT